MTTPSTSAPQVQKAPPAQQQLPDVARYKEDGSVLYQYPADWRARPLNDGRMVMDDFRALGPAGQPVSSYTCLDGGKTWTLAASLTAARAAP